MTLARSPGQAPTRIVLSSQRYIPQKGWAAGKSPGQNACTDTTSGQPSVDAAQQARGELPIAKIGVSGPYSRAAPTIPARSPVPARRRRRPPPPPRGPSAARPHRAGRMLGRQPVIGSARRPVDHVPEVPGRARLDHLAAPPAGTRQRRGVGRPQFPPGAATAVAVERAAHDVSLAPGRVSNREATEMTQSSRDARRDLAGARGIEQGSEGGDAG